ncbi:hypothetical protein [Hyphomonas sp. KY3]|uniref:hypothetical protein n=1 Tax=Hyphomonas sp. KY3 TaxID=2016196 RepID=UPI001A8CF269|nr:hypothetical protein [Hyphomonas sp. KY3]
MASSKDDQPDKQSGELERDSAYRRHEVPTPANDAGVSDCGPPYIPANLERWAKLPCWSTVEAACVTRGYEPGPLQQTTREEVERRPEVLDQIEYRIELFTRAVQVGEFGELITPLEALNFLECRDEKYPGKLREVAERIRPLGQSVPLRSGDMRQMWATLGDVASQANKTEQESSNSGQTKIINSLQRMLLAIVVSKMDFNPDRPQNPTAKLIGKAMYDLGMKPLHEDSIRRHLNDAAAEHWDGWPQG